MGSQPGTVLGTAAYMSPEQARGAAVDHCTDIFSFGCVLHEMLSGRRAFEGETSVETMHAILKNEPATLPDSVPQGLARIALRCLDKQPEERFQSARDLAFALEALSGTGESHALPAASATRRAKSWTVIGPLMLLSLAAGASIAWMLRQPAPSRVVKLSILPPQDASFEPLGTGGAPVLSPDGRSIVFVAAQNGRQMLWVRPLDSTLARSLPGTDGARGPFWSPDSGWIAFVSEGKLRKIEASGGPIQTLASVPTDTLASASGTWNRDNIMVISTSTRSALYRIHAGGGDLEPVTRLDGSETSHIGPAFLPDGRRFVFHVRSGGPVGSIYAGSLDSKERKLLLSDVTRAVYASSSRASQGYLLYVRGTALVAHPFDAGKVSLAGTPTVLADHVGTTTGGTLGDFSVASHRVLSYRNADSTKYYLVWVDRSGKRLPGLPMRETRVSSPRISPDGKRLAFSFDSGQAISRGSDIWVHDIERNVSSRLTFGRESVLSPIWSPDGKKIAYGSFNGLYVKDAAGGGSEEVLFPNKGALTVPRDWSVDGKFITFMRAGESRDLWILPLTGESKPYALLSSPFDEVSAQFAPGRDVKWFAYDSTESGRSEIYVQTFPPGGGRWQVSNEGGFNPRWRADGRELYYVAPDYSLMAVDIQLDPTVRVGVPRKLFTLTPINIISGSYDVSSDGQRFAVITADQPKMEAITIVLNWEEELKR
jgi:Tol biopolymer transport system component